MTSNTDGAAQGEAWTKRAVPYGNFTYWSVVCDSRYVAQSLAESDCDRIIADHRKAQTADVLVKALEELNEFAMALAGAAGLKQRHIIRAALAQFHAATEEATR